jgi:hypothetical protein
MADAKEHHERAGYSNGKSRGQRCLPMNDGPQSCRNIASHKHKRAVATQQSNAMT